MGLGGSLAVIGRASGKLSTLSGQKALSINILCRTCDRMEAAAAGEGRGSALKVFSGCHRSVYSVFTVYTD
ncbi:hypothetical protein RRG08_050008 [Elysia crispata]|uniref:Uncharacterized protein n=1 Tax=Elysia crispata TaxID=231223 RepID=A0AAE1B971_9GAST|nr:hypothetical protein RRG08_050008 [Elysia crispata]